MTRKSKIEKEPIAKPEPERAMEVSPNLPLLRRQADAWCDIYDYISKSTPGWQYVKEGKSGFDIVLDEIKRLQQLDTRRKK